MNTTDIRKGDLVKATSIERPEEYLVFRLAAVSGVYAENDEWVLRREDHTFEVLERPFDEELLKGAIAAYRDAQGNIGPLHPVDRKYYEEAFTRVLEFVRQYDKENSK